MKTLKLLSTVVVGIIVGALALYGVYALMAGSSQKASTVGFIPGGVNFTHFGSTLYAGGDIVEGGGVFATTTGGTTDLFVESDFLPSNFIQYTPYGAVTVTLPWDFSSSLQNIGDEVSSYIKNLSTTTNNITIAAAASSTQMVLMGTTSAVISPGAVGQFDCIRSTLATTTCLFYH